MKKLNPYLIVALLVLVSFILLFNKLILLGIGLLAAALVILGIQQLINLNVKVTLSENNIKNLDEKNNNLLLQNQKLLEENSYFKDRHFQITQIKSILELNLFEIDSKFTRAICNKEKINDRDIKYFGSLSISMKAKYGIDYKDLRFKYDGENDVLTVANINPKFLSFGNRKLEWDFFEIYEYRYPNLLADKQWMTSDDLYQYANTLKEKYRVSTETSLEKGPEELEWIHAPIMENVGNTIKILFNGLCKNIRITDKADETFLNIDNLSYEKITEQKKLAEHTD